VTRARIDLTIIDEASIEPLFERTLTDPVRPGIQALRLVDLDLSLAPDTTYRWYVTMVLEPGRRSNDAIAGGAIQRTTTHRRAPAVTR